MLTGLRHRAVGRGDDKDRAVHLGGASDHVLDEVSVSRAIDVRVVALVRLVFDVRHGDRDDLGGVTNGAALGDVRVGLDLGETFARLAGEDLGRERRFAVVDVADGADVDVRFLAFECGFSHGGDVGLGCD